MITVPSSPAPPATTGPPASAPQPPLPWAGTVAAGVAVLLAGSPVQAVLRGSGWVTAAAAAVAVVALAGLVLHRRPVPVVAAGQCGALLLLLTAAFTDEGVLGVFPGPRAAARLGELINGAGRQISLEIAPVSATPELLVLVTAAFGLLAVAVHLAAVSAAAPAAAGVPLLAAFAIPTALADGPLPVSTTVVASAGYALLLLVGDGARAGGRRAALRRLPTATAMVAVAVLLAVAVGSAAGFVGTAGRFGGTGVGGSGGTAIGLTPFTSLRGQLSDAAPVELLRVRGLPRATYLRALTLSEYVAGVGWAPARPAPGMPLPGPVQLPQNAPGDRVDVRIENVGLYDYWLPLYGDPLSVTGLPSGAWAYDQRSGTGYSRLPREDPGWQQTALLPRPSAAELRRVSTGAASAPGFASLAGVDPRVIALARSVTAGRDTDFDRAMALQDFFTARDSPFRYSLQTAPPRGDDALVEFLTVGRTGYCEQFASAMAVMLRAVDIPSRVAVGFTGGTDLGEYRSIRTSDAHAWVEAYFPGSGWVAFDPTPLTDGRTITPEYVLEARGETGPEAAAEPAPASGPNRLEPDRPLPVPVPVDAPSPAAGPAAGAASGLPLWPVPVLLVLVAGALTPALLRARQRAARLAAMTAGGPDAAPAAWREVLAESVDRGVPGATSDTVRGAARRLVREHRLDPDAQQAVRGLVEAVEASWYGGRHPEPGGLDELVRRVRAGIAAGSPLDLRRRVWPRSLRTRRRAGAPEHTTAASRN